VTDRHGASWTLSDPTLLGDARTIRVSSNQNQPNHDVDYVYDAMHGDRLTNRTPTAITPATPQVGIQRQRVRLSRLRRERQQDGVRNRRPRQRHQTHHLPGRQRPGTCNSEYFGYWPEEGTPLDPLDPRTDVQLWAGDARSAGPTDKHLLGREGHRRRRPAGDDLLPDPRRTRGLAP
jgi:hypothetical protein